MVATVSFRWPDTTRLIVALLLVSLVLTVPTLAHAAGAGGQMPWDANLTRIVQSFTGPFAYAITMIGLVAGIATLWFAHHEASGFIKFVAFAVLTGSFLMGSAAFANTMGWTGSVV